GILALLDGRRLAAGRAEIVAADVQVVFPAAVLPCLGVRLVYLAARLIEQHAHGGRAGVIGRAQNVQGPAARHAQNPRVGAATATKTRGDVTRAGIAARLAWDDRVQTPRVAAVGGHVDRRVGAATGIGRERRDGDLRGVRGVDVDVRLGVLPRLVA